MPILLRRGSRGCWVQLCSLDKSCTDPSSLAWCLWSSQGETQGRVCLRTWRLSEDIQPLGVNWCTSIYLYSRNITKDLFIFPSLKFLCLSKLHGWVPIVPARITQILEDRIAWRWRWKKAVLLTERWLNHIWYYFCPRHSLHGFAVVFALSLFEERFIRDGTIFG